MSEPHTSDRRTVELLHDLAPSVKLSSSARRQIAERLRRSAERPWARWWWLAVPVAAAITFVALRVPTPQSTQHLSISACAVSRFSDGEHFHAALIGPADAEVRHHAISLRSGRLILEAGRETILSTADMQVRLAPKTFAELEVGGLHGRRVAVYRGQADVALVAHARVILAAGRALTDGLEGSVPSDGAVQAQGILADGPTPTICAVAKPTLAATPVVPVIPIVPIVSAEVPKRAPPKKPMEPTPVLVVPPEEPVLPELPSRRPAEVLAEAIKRLRHDHDANGALGLLDSLAQEEQAKPFEDEIRLLRIEAWLLLGKSSEALAVLDALSLSTHVRGAELRVLRADLRAAAGRCLEAIADYDAAIALPSLAERALFGHAGCSFVLGDGEAGRANLRDYLLRFPNGAHAPDAKRRLAE